jgi:hypothetical protein
MSADVWANLIAHGLLLDLDARGIVLSVQRGNLTSRQARLLTDSDRGLLVEHKPALLLLVLANSDAVLDRLLALRRGGVQRSAPLPGLCRACGDALPAAVPAGACGWCVLAGRQYRGASLPLELLGLFPEAIVGPYARRGSLEVGGGLRAPQGRREPGGLFAGVA